MKRGRRAQASRFERSENSTAGGLGGAVSPPAGFGAEPRKFCIFDHFKRLRWLKIACFLVRLGEGKVSEKMSVFRELFIPAEVAKCLFVTSCTSYRHNLVFLRG